MKLCAQCKQPMQRRTGERPAHFERRKYCAHSCYVEAWKGSGLSLRGIRVDGVSLNDPTWPKHKHRITNKEKRARILAAIKRILAAKQAAKVSRQ